MDAPIIRTATVADLPAIHDIFYRNEVVGHADPPPPGPLPAWLRHTLATGTLLVAELAGVPIGYAGLTIRDRVAFLTDLFVQPAHQSRGIGGALLRAILPPGDLTRCTLASSDPRALSRYIRAGMRPRWQNFWLLAESATLRLPPGDVRVAAADPADPDLLAWDRRFSGRDRPNDHRFWREQQGGIPLWLVRGDQRLGYAYIRFADGPIWHPHAATIGPVGTLADVGSEALLSLVQWSRERSPLVQIGRAHV